MVLCLDVGIGSEPGHRRNWFNMKGEVIGIDIRRNFKPDVLCDAQNLPFKDEVFDVVTASEVLEHLPNALKALQEWWRVLKTHGKLYLTTPNDAWIPVIVHIARRKKMSLHPEHFQSFNYRKLEWLVQYVGFDVLQIDFFTRYLQKGIMPRLAYTFRKLIPSIFESNIKLIAVKLGSKEEDLIKYCILQRYIDDYCFHKCQFRFDCIVWNSDGASYNEDLVYTCPYSEIRKAFEILAKLKNSKPFDYFVVTINKYLEIKPEIDRRLKQKIVII